MSLIPTATLDAAVYRANSYIDFLRQVRAADPAAANSFLVKPLLYSKTPWVVMLATIISALVVRKGLNLTPDETLTVVSIVVWLVSAVMRSISKGGIAGIIKTPAAVPEDADKTIPTP